MEMVGMCAIIIGAKHGAEPFAGGLVQAAQEGAFFAGSVPACEHRYAAAIAQNERRDIDGVGKGMFG
jgi:hypothetical protein